MLYLELEPLDIWLRALSAPVRDDPDSLDLHCLLAIKWPPSDSKGAHQPVIWGGCVFEYYPHINCALISYLVTRKNNEELLRLLMNESIEIIDRTAKEMGHISGCNCIFWEERVEQAHAHAAAPSTSAGVPATPGAPGATAATTAANAVLYAAGEAQLTANHRLSHQLGFRQIDVQYVVPPVAPEYPHKLRNWILTVLLTPSIPRIPFEEGEKYCIPSIVLRNFLSSIWRSAFVTGRITAPPEADADYRRIMQQVKIRRNIPLNELPWTIRQWTVVDLWEDYDEELLKMFYEQLLIPNFPIAGGIFVISFWNFFRRTRT